MKVYILQDNEGKREGWPKGLMYDVYDSYVKAEQAVQGLPNPNIQIVVKEVK